MKNSFFWQKMEEFRILKISLTILIQFRASTNGVDYYFYISKQSFKVRTDAIFAEKGNFPRLTVLFFLLTEFLAFHQSAEGLFH